MKGLHARVSPWAGRSMETRSPSHLQDVYGIMLLVPCITHQLIRTASLTESSPGCRLFREKLKARLHKCNEYNPTTCGK